MGYAVIVMQKRQLNMLYCAEYKNERQVLIIKLHEKEIHDMSLKNLLARKQGTKEEAL